MITRDHALQLLDQNLKNKNIIKHLFATEALMRALAKKFGENEETWAMTGLLHDLDWERTKDTPEKHGLVSCEILQSEDLSEEIFDAIRAHNEMTGIKPKTLLAKALHCGEAMTGLVVAAVLVQPSKKLADVKIDSLMKKYKEKSFAASVNRGIINKCEDLIGISVEELAKICLTAMQGIHGELGL